MTSVFSVLVSLVVMCNGALTFNIDLIGVWDAVNSNKSIQIKGKVPGGIYTDLIANHLIDDPYFRHNDVKYRWIAYEDWNYSRNFDVPSDILKYNKINLLCEGLDTVGNVYLNGKFVGQSDNMFIRYTFNIKPYIKEGNNNILVQFKSPVLYAKHQYDVHLMKKYAVPPICPPPIQQGECHPNFIRKIQSQFSWDWGPAFPSVGIWKNISIEAFNEVKIRDVIVQTEKEKINGKWSVEIKMFVDIASESSGVLKIFLNSEEEYKKSITISPVKDQAVVVLASFTTSQEIKKWWPNGFGDQPLYNLTVLYTSNKDEVTSKTVKIGFRTVKLIQEPIKNATEGLSFYFKINDHPIFMKGSNWIPADSFPERVTPMYTRRLLQSAKEANMNLLRVWGGGMYESEEFYKIADELGIMIWQDFMFACALYPDNEEFLSSVSVEVTQQVWRLQHHASILIWSGNNENEAALMESWWPTKVNFANFKKDYIELYIKRIMAIVTALDPNRPFAPSSPSNGLETAKEGYLAKNPQDPLFGDVHYYEYISNTWDWTTFPIPRFASEFGFQSWCSFETISKVTNKEDWNVSSYFISTRQHHMFGNKELYLGILLHLRIPEQCSKPRKQCEPVEVFKNTLYLTQIFQAMSLKTETEHYLRHQNEINKKSEGFTMGALYWQLNDIWQTVSWSSIEYGGKWKMAHYYAVNFFAPFLISPMEIEDELLVYSIVSKLETSQKLKMSIEIYQWDNFKPLYMEELKFTQKSEFSNKIFEADIDSLIASAGCKSRWNCFFYFTLYNSSSSIISTNFLFLSPLKDAIGLKTPNLTVSIIKEMPNVNDFELEVISDAIAPFVWLEATGIEGRFSDNGFLMITEKKKVVFHSWQNVTKSELFTNLSVFSLQNIY